MFAFLLDTERTNAMTIMKEASGDKNMSPPPPPRPPPTQNRVKKLLERTSKNNLLIRAFRLYLESEYITAGLKAL